MGNYLAMEYGLITADYYASFACTAGACRSTCCANWMVSLSKNEYLALKSNKSPAHIREIALNGTRRLRQNASDGIYAKMVLDDNGNCPYLTHEHLCALQLACGGSALSITCRRFPRIRVCINNTIFNTLSLGCEAVCEQLILKPTSIALLNDKVRFSTPGTARRYFSEIDIGTDTPFFEELFTLTTAILQNAAYPLAHRLSLLALALEQLPPEGELAAAFPKWFIKYAPLASTDSFPTPPRHTGDAIAAIKAAMVMACTGNSAFECPKVLSAMIKLGVKITTEGDTEVTYSQPAYLRAVALEDAALCAYPRAWENIVVALWQHSLLSDFTHPYSAVRATSCLYAMLRLTVLGNMDDNISVPQIADAISTPYRIWRHNHLRVDDIISVMDANGYTTAAHLAMITSL